MRFFATASIVATLAFSAFTSALPAPEANALAATVVQAREVEARVVVERATPSSVPQILASATTQLQGPIASLGALNKKTATTAAITPILIDINNILNTVLAELKFLVGVPLAEILLSVDGTVELAIPEVAQLVADLLFLVADALYALLGVVGLDLVVLGTELPVIGITLANIVTELGILIAGLLDALTPLVGELLVALEALVWTLLITVLNLL